MLQLSSMTGCAEFSSPREAFQKHPSGPSGPSGQEPHWMEHQACVQDVLGLVLSSTPWFCLGHHTTAGHSHQEAKDEPVGLLSDCPTCLTSKGVPPFAQSISTCLSATAMCQIPTPELYL